MPDRLRPLAFAWTLGCAASTALGAGPSLWSDDVEAAVARAIAAHAAPRPADSPAPLAVFDFDNTMILGDIGLAVAIRQAERHEFGFDPRGPNPVFAPALTARFAAFETSAPGAARERLQREIVYGVLAGYYRAWEQGGGRPEACAYLVRLLQGFTVGEANELARAAFQAGQREAVCVRRFADEAGSGPPFEEPAGIRLRPAIQDMVTRLRAAGFDLWVVSASAKRLVEAGAALYGIAPDHVIGMQSEENAGRLGTRVVPPITYGPGKVEAIRAVIGRMPALAFGDAETDFEMLRAAAQAILIDRGNETLNARCRAAGILIQPRFPTEPAAIEPCP